MSDTYTGIPEPWSKLQTLTQIKLHRKATGSLLHLEQQQPMRCELCLPRVQAACMLVMWQISNFQSMHQPILQSYTPPAVGWSGMQLSLLGSDAQQTTGGSRSTVLQAGGRTGVEGPGLSKWQRGLWGLGSVFMQYAWSRLDQIAAAQHWRDADSSPRVQQAWAVLRSCESALNVASLLNFLVFLRHGKYRQVLVA